MSGGGFECQFCAFYIFLIFNFSIFGSIIWKMSRIFHVWDLSGFIYPKFVQNSFMSRICPAKLSGIFSCPEYVWFYLSRFVQNSFMSRICPIFSAHKKLRIVNLTILPDIFQIFSEPHGQIPDIFDKIFWIFLFCKDWQGRLMGLKFNVWLILVLMHPLYRKI
jgi:hypothetical protein